MSKALDTISKLLSIQMQMTSLQLAQKRLQGEEPTALDKAEELNKRIGAVVTAYENVDKVRKLSIQDPELQKIAIQGALMQRANYTMDDASIALGGLVKRQRGAGTIARNSLETYKSIGKEQGIDNTTLSGMDDLFLATAATSHGMNYPQLDPEREAKGLVASYFDMAPEDISYEDEEPLFADSIQINSALGDVVRKSVEAFNKADKLDLSPNAKMLYAVSTGLAESNVGKSDEERTIPRPDGTTITEVIPSGINTNPQAMYYVAREALTRLQRVQQTKVQSFLAQIPALTRKYGEEGAQIIADDYLRMYNMGDEMFSDKVVSNIGQYEILNAVRDPRMLENGYMRIQNTMSKFYQQYPDIENTEDRFKVFVDALIDTSISNMKTALINSPKEQYQMNNLRIMKEANQLGQLSEAFPALYPYIQDMFNKFDGAHNAKVIAKRDQLKRFDSQGFSSAIAYDGTIIAWRKTTDATGQEDTRRETMIKNLVSSPAITDLLRQRNRVTTDSQGNSILNVGDIDVFALDAYNKAMTSGGNWGAIPIAETNRRTFTLGEVFSPEGIKYWNNSLQELEKEVVGNPNFFTKASKEEIGNWIDRIAKLKTSGKGISLGRTIASHPDLIMALRASGNDIGKVRAVLNAGLLVHYNTVDSNVLTTAYSAEDNAIQQITGLFPAELQKQFAMDIRNGSVQTILDYLPELEDNYTRALNAFESVVPQQVQPTYTYGAFTTPLNYIQTPEAERLRINYLVAKNNIIQLKDKLQNYINRIKKDGDVQALDSQLGYAPPRSKAFLVYTQDIIRGLDLFLKTGARTATYVSIEEQQEEELQ